NQNQHGDGQDRPEHPAPIEVFQDDPAGGGTKCRGCGDDHSNDAHGAAALFKGDHIHHGGHQQWHHDGGTDGLDYTSHDQHQEGGRQRGDQGASCEDQHRDHVNIAKVEAGQNPAGGWNHHGHGEHKRGGHPLDGGFGDV